MANELKLKVAMEGARAVSQDIDGVKSSIGQMDAVAAKAAKSMTEFFGGFSVMQSQVQVLTGAFAGLMSVQKTVSAASDFQGLTARMKLLTGSAIEAGAAMQVVYDIAQRQGASLMAVGDSYAKIGQAMIGLGGTSADTAQMVETVAASLRLGNASTTEAASAMRQFGQAMAKGKLNGDEFVSLMENAPYLMDAVAASMGKTKGELFGMAEAGQLTAQVFSNAVLSSFDDVTSKAATLPQTIGQHMETVVTAFTKAAGESRQAGLISAAAMGTMSFAAEHASGILDTLANVALAGVARQLMLGTAAVYARVTATLADNAANVVSLQSTVASTAATASETAAKVAALQASVAGVQMSRAEVLAKLDSTRASMTQASAQLAAAKSAGALSFALAAAREATVMLTVAQTRQAALVSELAALGAVQATVQTSIASATAAHTAATLAQTEAQTALNAATSLGARTMGLLGGPIGVITALLGLGLTAWSLWGSSAKEGEEKAAQAVERSTPQIMADLDNQIARIERRNALAAKNLSVNGLDLNSPAADRLGALQIKLDALEKKSGLSAEQYLTQKNQLLAEQGLLQQKLFELEQKSAPERAANALKAHAQAMAKYAPVVDKATAAIEAERKALGGAFTPADEAKIRAHFATRKMGAAVVDDAAKGLALYNDLMAKDSGLSANFDEQWKMLSKVGLSLDDLAAAQAVLLSQQPLMVEAQKEAVKEDIEAAKAMNDLRLASEKQITTASTMLDQIEFEARLLEMSTEQRALATMERELERQGIVKGTQAYDGYIAKLREATSLKTSREGSIKAADDMREAQKKAAEESGKYWEDALMRAFESGKGFFQSLWDTIKNTLKTQVLKVAVQGVMGTLGIGAAGAAAAGDSSSSGSLLGVASNLSTLYDGITGGFTKLTASMSGSLQHAADYMMTSSSDLVAGMGESLSAHVGTLSSVAGYAAGAAAGLAVGNAISGQFGSSNTVTAGTIIGSIVGGPIGGAIGGAIGGLVNRAFGMGNTELRSQGTRGTFAAGGTFDGQNYANYHQDGGWFRSDKDWTTTSAIDQSTVTSWQTAFIGVKSSVSGMAASLGLATDQISAYTKYIDIAAGTTSEQITALFTSMADEMATAAAPGIAALAKTGETASVTLSRLSSSLSTVNQYMDQLGHSLLAVSLTGADAASQLADLFGGIDQFTAKTQAYYETYYTEAERTAKTAENVAKGLALVGVAMPASQESFRTLVDGLDLATEAGRATYAVMMALAPEFATVADAAAASADLFFDALETRFDELRQSIESERTAVASASASILGATPKTAVQLQADITAAKVALPSDAGVLSSLQAKSAAQTGLTAAQAAQSATASAYGGAVTAAQANLTSTVDKYKALANYFQQTAVSFNGYQIKVNATGTNNDAFGYNAATNQLNGWSSTTDATQTGRSYGHFLEDSQRFRDALAGVIAQLNGGNAALSTAAAAVATAQASYTSAMGPMATATNEASATLTAADTAAKAALLAYGEAMTQYGVDAEKAVTVLGKLREETVAYYEAQKALASTMSDSAATLRSAVTSARSGQLSSSQSLVQQQGDFASSYSLALSTSGADKAGYADKMGAALPDLSSALMDASSTRSDWALATAKLYAQSETIASQLEAGVSGMDYEAESLSLLANIDLSLNELDTNTAILKNAIDGGTAINAAGLRAIVTQLGGVPAFAGGGYHSGGLRLVGENGPELEVTGPSRIYNASQISLGGSTGGTARLEALIQGLLEDNANMRAELRAIAIASSKTARILERVTPDGNSLQMVAA